jgi:Holliday junction resolvasome RuvABC DNA-binding subunit
MHLSTEPCTTGDNRQVFQALVAIGGIGSAISLRCGRRVTTKTTDNRQEPPIIIANDHLAFLAKPPALNVESDCL